MTTSDKPAPEPMMCKCADCGLVYELVSTPDKFDPHEGNCPAVKKSAPEPLQIPLEASTFSEITALYILAPDGGFVGCYFDPNPNAVERKEQEVRHMLEPGERFQRVTYVRRIDAAKGG